MAPRDIAAALAEALAGAPGIVSAEVAGPGFLNLRLEPGRWFGVIPAALAAGTDFGRSDLGAGRRVNVEFVSANPTGPMHVGHVRGAVFGDALAGLLAFAGYEVTREYYINDGGAQVDVLARSAYERYREACGLEPEIAEGLYPGDYLIPVGEALKARHGDTLLDKGEAVLARRGPRVRHRGDDGDDPRGPRAARRPTWTTSSPRSRSTAPAGSRRRSPRSRRKGLIYEGTLEPPKGKLPEDWEPREQTLFRSTAYGDDTDRPVRKSDGGWTYFAPDIAYHFDKIERGYDELIDVLGADHGGYVKRMKAAVAALSDGRVPLDVKLCQLVKLTRAASPSRCRSAPAPS